KKYRVDYDGLNRPRVIDPEGVLYSISKVNAKRQGFADEEAACQALCDAMNARLESNEKPTFDEYYIRIAQAVSFRSSCIKRKVGALIVLDNRIVSTGYNGTPRGTPNCDSGGCARCNDFSIPSGTKLDSCWCSH